MCVCLCMCVCKFQASIQFQLKMKKMCAITLNCMDIVICVGHFIFTLRGVRKFEQHTEDKPSIFHKILHVCIKNLYT